MAFINYAVKAAPVYRNPSPLAGAATGVAAGVTPTSGPGVLGGIGHFVDRTLGPAVRRVGGALNGIPQVRTQDQPDPTWAAMSEAAQQQRAQSMINALINPQLAAIRAEFDRRQQRGSAAINAATAGLVSQLAGFQGSARDIYSQAQASTAATEAALAGALSGAGGSEAANLSSRLAGINAPAATSAAAAAAQQAGIGAAGASYGKGSAALEDLIARGAAAQEYGAKLPGFGSGLGLQQLGQFQGKIGDEEATQLAALRSQVPGLVSSTLSDIRSTELTKAQERERIREYGQSRTDRLAAAKADAANRLAVAQARAATTGPTTRTVGGDLFQYNPKTGQWVKAIDAPAKTAQPMMRSYRPGDTVVIRSPDGHITQIKIPAAPKDETPKVINLPDGSHYSYNTKTKSWEPASGLPTVQKPATWNRANANQTLKMAALGGGGWDPTTGKASKEFGQLFMETINAGFEAQGSKERMTSPPTVITRQQMEDMGILPRTRPQADKVWGTGTNSQWVVTMHPDGTMTRQKNPAYTPSVGKGTDVAGKARTHAIQDRGDAMKEARDTAYSEAQKLLGKPVKNTKSGKFLNKGLYLDPQGKPTNDPNKAAHEGQTKSWAEAYAKIYAAIGADGLKARYGIREEDIYKLIAMRLKVAGFKEPQTPKPKPPTPVGRTVVPGSSYGGTDTYGSAYHRPHVSRPKPRQAATANPYAVS